MKERYRNILEKVYEVEGLLLLAMSKEETPEGLDDLIERRLSELMADEETCGEVAAPVASEEQAEAPDVTVVAPEAAVEKDPVAPLVEDTVDIGEPDMTFYALEDDDDPRDSRMGASRPPRASGRDEARRRKEPGRPQPVFSLNDRFLFIREIFEGDAAAFNAALNRVAASSGFADAQDFLVGECGLRPDDEETDARFLAVIEAYFK